MERLRDPSHVRALTEAELVARLDGPVEVRRTALALVAGRPPGALVPRRARRPRAAARAVRGLARGRSAGRRRATARRRHRVRLPGARGGRAGGADERGGRRAPAPGRRARQRDAARAAAARAARGARARRGARRRPGRADRPRRAAHRRRPTAARWPTLGDDTERTVAAIAAADAVAARDAGLPRLDDRDAQEPARPRARSRRCGARRSRSSRWAPRDHHYLGAERHLRDVLAFFGALVVPTAAYLSSRDFADGGAGERAAAELDAVIAAALTLAGRAPGPARARTRSRRARR